MVICHLSNEINLIPLTDLSHWVAPTIVDIELKKWKSLEFKHLTLICLQLDTSRISRLLDHLSDDDDCNDRPIVNKLNEYDDFNVNNDVCLFPISSNKNLDPNNLVPISNNKNLDPNNPVPISSEEDIVLDVEDLLQLAIDERKGKQEANQVWRKCFWTSITIFCFLLFFRAVSNSPYKNNLIFSIF